MKDSSYTLLMSNNANNKRQNFMKDSSYTLLLSNNANNKRQNPVLLIKASNHSKTEHVETHDIHAGRPRKKNHRGYFILIYNNQVPMPRGTTPSQVAFDIHYHSRINKVMFVIVIIIVFKFFKKLY